MSSSMLNYYQVSFINNILQRREVHSMFKMQEIIKKRLSGQIDDGCKHSISANFLVLRMNSNSEENSK